MLYTHEMKPSLRYRYRDIAHKRLIFYVRHNNGVTVAVLCQDKRVLPFIRAYGLQEFDIWVDYIRLSHFAASQNL